MAQKEAKKNMKAEVSAAWWKQLELLSQRKVAVCIARAEEAQRVLEASEEVTPSRIAGYGKGKVPEKRVCMNCLQKGVECEWDEGGQGESELIFFFFDFGLTTTTGKSCQPCQRQKIRCTLGGLGTSSKRPHTEEVQTLRPPKKLRSEPAAVIQTLKKPEVYLKVKCNYLFHVQMASLIETLVSEMVKQREAEERTAVELERLMKWVEETESESDGEELEKSEVGEREE